MSALPLDPEPWQARDITGRAYPHRVDSFTSAGRLRMPYYFEPRDGFSQNREDYPA